MSSHLISFFVSGQTYLISEATLKRHPKSMLSDKTLNSPYYDRKRKGYVFDRPRQPFEVILYYFITGLISRPVHIPLEVLYDELMFFRIDTVNVIYRMVKVERMCEEVAISQRAWKGVAYFRKVINQPSSSWGAIFTNMLCAALSLSYTGWHLFVINTWAGRCDTDVLVNMSYRNSTIDDTLPYAGVSRISSIAFLSWSVFEIVIRLALTEPPFVQRAVGNVCTFTDLIGIISLVLSVSIAGTKHARARLLMASVPFTRIIRYSFAIRHYLESLGRAFHDLRSIFVVLFSLMYFMGCMLFAMDDGKKVQGLTNQYFTVGNGDGNRTLTAFDSMYFVFGTAGASGFLEQTAWIGRPLARLILLTTMFLGPMWMFLPVPAIFTQYNDPAANM